MESHYVADNCAEYLRKFYILPHTYQEAFARRVIVPLLAMGIIVPFMVAGAFGSFLAAEHRQPAGHENAAVFLFCIAGVLAIIFFASASRARLVISHDAIEATGAFSKTKILASDVLGYAADYIQPNRGPRYLQFFVIHRALKQKEKRTRIYFDPNDLTDARLQGLFRSMHNYGSENLNEVLMEVNEGEFTGRTRFVVVAFSGLVIFALWLCIRLIRSFH